MRAYLQLAKPGIIVANIITATAGFLFAIRGHSFDFGLLAATLLGIALIIASGCVFNNYIDRDIDAKMERTKHRALVTGAVSGRNAIAYGIVLGIAGIFILARFTNALTLTFALIGLFIYVVIYAIGKRRTPYGTIIGSIAGAVPPLVGYTAASGRFDACAAIIALIIILWQMPHFFAIAIFRLEDYIVAGLPVLPVKKGLHTTKIHMLWYIIAFLLASPLLTFFGYAGYLYLTIITLLGAGWLILCIKGFHVDDEKKWARSMFKYSLGVIMGFSVLAALNLIGAAMIK